MAVVRMRYLVIKSYLVPSHQNRQLGPAGARKIESVTNCVIVDVESNKTKVLGCIAAALPLGFGEQKKGSNHSHSNPPKT
jgi:hypothetical protein